MRHKKLLFGVNAKCKQCVKECKQFKQVTVIYCLMFVNKENGIPCKNKKELKSLQG